jgi:uncharacterized phage infection (PIP) family protein YhgE
MSDTENAVPAGAGDEVSASTAPLNVDAAAAMFERSERASEERDTTRDERPARSPTPSSEDEGESQPHAEEVTTEEPEGSADTNTPEDDETVEFEKLHGNTKVRLRDGTEWTVGELKRRIDDLRSLDTGKQEFTAQQQRFQQMAAQVAQQAQQFEQIAPQAIAAIQAQLPAIPDKPDIALRGSDPFAYQERLDDHYRAIEDYNGKVAQMQAIAGQQQQLEQQRQQEAAQVQQGFLAEQQQRLYASMPELRDTAKREAFAQDFVKYGTETYGFEMNELNSAYDHRLMLMARDAIAYRKLQANKPKPSPAKPQATVPVAQPGRRPSGQEARSSARSEELSSALNRRGGISSVDEAARLLEKFG